MHFARFVLILIKRLFVLSACCSFFTLALASESNVEYLSGFSTVQSTADNEEASDIAFFAMSLSGVHYKYGGNAPDVGLDCSGLVRYVVKEVLGAELPRSSEEISHVGRSVEDHELQPGDLVFYNTLQRAFSHVGIYLGENRFIHSPASGGKVRIENMNLGYWKQRFNGARRIIGLQKASK